MMFFNFLNFFVISLEFYITDRVGTDRNDNFYFHSFSTFPNLFWLEKKPSWCFLIFFFSYFFGILYAGSGKNSTELFFLFSLFQSYSQPILAWKEATMVFFNFLNFFAIFLEFSITGRVGTDRNDNFYFHSFLTFPNLFGPERSHHDVFLLFFCYFFGILYSGSSRNWSKR